MDAFRRQILSNSDSERVEVNQRDLIDKILARYTSEFFIYRELIQNSDDADSLNIEIRFETENNKIGDKVKRIIFKNDGFSFRDEDWNRLKNIAEGNPDEQKIGVFGVGFYSLFSVCDNPFVYSGGQAMAFEWQGNQLFTRQGRLESSDDNNRNATFLLEMKELIELPYIEEFARFLVNSLGFVESIQEVSVYFDDRSVIKLSKKMEEPATVDITPEFDTFSPEKMFQLTSVSVRDVQLDIKILIPLQRRLLTEEASISFRIARGNLDVNVNNEFSKKMQQLTKKNPPSETTIQIIFTEFDDIPSENYDGNTSPVFRDLLPYPKQGKVHICFSTKQTVGCHCHVAARVIPTMQRELIDFENTTIAEYNKEMLCLAGTLCRVLYEDEMFQQIYYITDNDTHSIREKRAAHALAHFTFNSSTPDVQVGEIIESQFFSCKREFPILSTEGVLPISEVRMPDPKMLGFIKTIPIIPKIVFKQCNRVKDKGLIKELALRDVLNELRNRELSEGETIKLLEWWISYNKSLKLKGKSVDKTEFEQFKILACIDDRSQSLMSFHYFLNPNIIPPDVDIPAEVLPYAISKEFKNEDLKNWLGFPELPLVGWARFISNNPNLEADPRFAESVLKILAEGLSWSTWCINFNSQSDKETISQLFERKRCIPTTSDMKIPKEAYFEDVNSLFPDLPTIQFEDPSISNIKNLMELLGVRKVVELELIISYLIDQRNCDHMQVIRYLASKFSDLTPDEIGSLKSQPIWHKENSGYSPVRYSIVSDLYTPLTEHRELGLPVIDWNERWSHNTQEGKFLIKLGIKEYPKLQKILELAAPPTDTTTRNNALTYFINNFEKYSNTYNSARVNAFLPCLDPYTYAKPSECFINIECRVMNFPVVCQDLRLYLERFGVRQHPGREELLNRLVENLPQNEDQAKEIFEYLATQQGYFTDADWEILLNLRFIPIRDNDDRIIHKNPRSCFFNSQEGFLDDFFSCINFGERANRFLQNCGVKNEPSTTDFSKLLVESSNELWNSIGNDKEEYKNILRKIAFDFNTITNDLNLIIRMKREPILLAVEREVGMTLASATEIYVNDDIIYRQIFNLLLTAPEDYRLETLYKNLGCKSLRESVRETSIQRGNIQVTPASEQLQEKIRERASLFYYDHPKNEVKENEEWLRNLKVREIDYIETSYELETTTESKRNNTAILQDGLTNSWTLFITSESSSLDISKHIVKNIYKSHNWKGVSYVNMILTASLSSLKEMGYPVERILQRPI